MRRRGGREYLAIAIYAERAGHDNRQLGVRHRYHDALIGCRFTPGRMSVTVLGT